MKWFIYFIENTNNFNLGTHKLKEKINSVAN